MIDFLLDPETGDLLVEGGDLVIGRSDEQNKALLLKIEKGALKEHPTKTVGIRTYIETEDVGALLREVRTKFTFDGMTVNKCTIDTNGQMVIDSKY